MLRGILTLSAIALVGLSLAGCKKPPSPKELKSLRGGTTKVVVYGFCIPLEHLIKTTVIRHTYTFVVNGKKIGTIRSCSSATFRVPSGYWNAQFTVGANFHSNYVHGRIYRPRKTQYLYMYPSGYGNFAGRWVNKAQAEQDIAKLKQVVGQLL